MKYENIDRYTHVLYAITIIFALISYFNVNVFKRLNYSGAHIFSANVFGVSILV